MVTLFDKFIVLLLQFIALSIFALKLSERRCIELLRLNFLTNSHRKRSIELIADLLCQTLLLVVNQLLQRCIPLFQILRHLLAIGPLMTNDLLADGDGFHGRLQPLRQVLDHLVLVLRFGDSLCRLQFRFELPQILIVLSLLRLHLFFLKTGLLGCLLDDFLETFSLFDHVVHGASLAHLLD